MEYEIIVVGGGHAGCEASLASARLNHKTLLITGNIKNIADMPCNPSIGGPAKGILVREIDALGGEMGINTDKSHIQLKMLNTKKGPAVWALRAQADKITYPEEMLKTLNNQENLSIKEAIVDDLLVSDNEVYGVKLENGEEIKSKIVILTTGTYLKADILVGSTRTPGGPHGEKEAKNLSDNLRKLGLTIQRLKTGTPQRIAADSIDYSSLEIEKGDEVLRTFSYDTNPLYKIEEQEPCYLTYTNEKTHEIIKNNLEKSSMYGGFVRGIGPRYCPSIEDKVVRFQDKERHQLFLEPESRFYDDIYIQGFSTSMPYDVQEEMVHSLKGLENAKILKYAYAIEYDAIDPLEMQPSLENKIIKNLFTAGQINGTSGYEEAAAQGLMAGINASLKIRGKDPLILKRDEAYIGVLIDDLVTKGTKEPYRMLTSRAEYRLLLRHDNADIRLREYGHQVGLIDEVRYQKFREKLNNIEECIEYLKRIKLYPTENDLLKEMDTSPILDSITLYDFLKRPEITIDKLIKFEIFKREFHDFVREQAEISIKYEGYIKKSLKEAEKLKQLENIKIDANLDYDKIPNLASEARQKLNQVHPITLGQATRISGVNPSDIAVLSVYLKRYKNDQR
ncbi:MAG: tRNA uridine-5-carboxymethylaminomethyl(34) synthesis enzyme MnmG [Bacilli bacterium]|nr:tRNA uridine-5-carboxymethylaminomethyl(34) synthesis enzyme MnmG [Bacilli bacterium]